MGTHHNQFPLLFWRTHGNTSQPVPFAFLEDPWEHITTSSLCFLEEPWVYIRTSSLCFLEEPWVYIRTGSVDFFEEEPWLCVRTGSFDYLRGIGTRHPSRSY
jgi:hypothetical protein